MSSISKKALSVIMALLFCFAAVTAFFQPAKASAASAISYKITYTAKSAKLTLTPTSKTNTIYYTTDGSKPTKRSAKYTGALTAKKSVVIRAAEYKGNSAVASLKITLCPRTAAPKLRESGGTLTVTSATPKAKIYYTTDGSAPTSSSDLYSSPIKAKAGVTYKFRAFRSGFGESKILEYVYKDDESEYGFKASDEQKEILKLVNRERTAKGLKPLSLDETLCSAAEIRAKEIASKFSHDRPDGSKYYDLLEDLGIVNVFSAENIAEGYLDPEDVMTGWMGSSGHRKNILGENYDHIGIGVYKSGRIMYWVQIFGGLD